MRRKEIKRARADEVKIGKREIRNRKERIALFVDVFNEHRKYESLGDIWKDISVIFPSQIEIKIHIIIRFDSLNN